MVLEAREVDILMTTYNQEDFIRETLESVVNQTYDNIKNIIVTDDGSNDNTPKIIEEYANKYPIINPILAKENKGIAYNLNRGLAQLESEYVAFIAGDDVMFPQRVEKQVEYLNNNPDVVVCSHDMDVFNSMTGKSMGRFSEILNHKKVNGKTGVNYLFDPAMNQSPSSYMYLKDAIPKKGMDTRLKLLNELIFDVDVLMQGKLGYIDEVLGMYRIHSNNAHTSNYSQNYAFEEFLISYAILTQRYPEIVGLIKRARSNLYFGKVIRCIMAGNKKRAVNLSKVLISEGDYIKGITAYLMSSLISPGFLNKLHESQYKNKITNLFYRTV